MRLAPLRVAAGAAPAAGPTGLGNRAGGRPARPAGPASRRPATHRPRCSRGAWVALATVGAALGAAVPGVARAQGTPTASEQQIDVGARVLAPIEFREIQPLQFINVVAGAPHTVRVNDLTLTGRPGASGILVITGNPGLPIRVQFASLPTVLTRADGTGDPLPVADWTGAIELNAQHTSTCTGSSTFTPAPLTAQTFTLSDAQPFATLCVGATVNPPPTLRSGFYGAGEYGSTPSGIVVLVNYDL